MRPPKTRFEAQEMLDLTIRRLEGLRRDFEITGHAREFGGVMETLRRQIKRLYLVKSVMPDQIEVREG